MGYDVSTGAAYAVLYGVLCFFTLLAIGSAGWLDCLPHWATCFCTLHGTKSSSDNNAPQASSGTDYFLSARNSAGVCAIGLSFFASGMGAWVLYGTTEMGATPELSWLGVMGYSFASAFPGIIICWVGPAVRDYFANDDNDNNNNNNNNKAFSTTDFVRDRYGRIMQFAIASVSGFYMFIFIVAELTATSNVFALLTNDFSKAYGIGISLSMGGFTIFYTTLAGLPASIVTDRFQAIIVAVLVLVLTIAVTAKQENQITKEEFDVASNWTGQGAEAAVTLVIAIASAELFNQSTWQRVWAAETVPVMRKGFLLGSAMILLLMMFFGIIGMIAYANDPTAYDDGTKYAYLSFFDLLEPLSDGWHILVLVLVVALSASSLDSLQNGLTSVFYHDLVRIGWNPVWIVRGLMVAVNIPAVWMASKKHDVIGLFLVADIVCATSVFPVFLGLQTTDYGTYFKAPTELGAFMGCLSGMATVLVTGVVIGAKGGAWEYFWLRNEAICALCGDKTMITFIVTPAVSLVATYVFTFLDVWLRGDRARRPIIPLPFDKDTYTKDGGEQEAGENDDFEKDVMDRGDEDGIEKEDTDHPTMEDNVYEA